MLIPNHPHDERLAALASREPRCGHRRDAWRARRLLRPVHRGGRPARRSPVSAGGASRHPAVAPAASSPGGRRGPAPMGDRLGGWARRFFAPVLASGAALALVGAIGTAGPSLGGLSGPSRTRVSPHSRSRRRSRQQHRSQRRKPPVAPQPAKVFERLPPTGAAPRRRPAIRPEPARRGRRRERSRERGTGRGDEPRPRVRGRCHGGALAVADGPLRRRGTDGRGAPDALDPGPRGLRSSEGQAPHDDRGGQQDHDDRTRQHGGPARVAEPGRQRLRPRRSPGPEHGNLVWLTDRPAARLSSRRRSPATRPTSALTPATPVGWGSGMRSNGRARASRPTDGGGRNRPDGPGSTAPTTPR